MTTYIVWVLFLYAPVDRYTNGATSTMVTIDNIASEKECETKLAESIKRWPGVIKSGMCLQVTKVK